MSRISCPHVKRLIFVLTLLLFIALFLVGCAKGTHSISGTTTTNTQSSASDDATKVKNGYQQAQDLLQSLDNAQKDANDASNSGDQLDTNELP